MTSPKKFCSDLSGTKHKMQARVIKKLVYMFSRIAKSRGCKCSWHMTMHASKHDAIVCVCVCLAIKGSHISRAEKRSKGFTFWLE